MARRMTFVVALLFAAASCGDDDAVTDTSADDGSDSVAATTDDETGSATTASVPTSTVPTTTVPSTTAPPSADQADTAGGTTTAPADPDAEVAAVDGATTTAPATTAAPVTAPPATVPTTMPATTAPTTSPPTTVPAPPFAHSVRAVTAEQLGVSWREGCPVPVEDLRWIDLSHWNDTGAVVTGSLVVHTDHAVGIVQAFSRIYEARFPIHSMRPITDFAGSDDASMAANNTSAFNCREISGRPGVWSQHAYGGAVDINPLLNPWVRGSAVDPPTGARYVDRSLDVPGLIRSGDAVTAAFAEIGWGWGGNWSSTKDYQHFSHNGR